MSMSRAFFFIFCWFNLVGASGALLPRQSTSSSGGPIATVLNGSYQGIELPTWNQEAFLGIPYTQPPLGNLRFRRPQSLNTSWTGVRNATQYGYSCYQYASKFNLSEDCLTLNVVRPAGTKANDALPVLIWIYGGGLTSGSSADPQYNVSGILNVSQRLGQPIITVSINYRLGLWGFLSSTQLLEEGNLNVGLLDQRMAMRWVQENIAAFGGDPTKVTIWGESAGAQSIGLHLSSYGGRNDDLYRGCKCSARYIISPTALFKLSSTSDSKSLLERMRSSFQSSIPPLQSSHLQSMLSIFTDIHTSTLRHNGIGWPDRDIDPDALVLCLAVRELDTDSRVLDGVVADRLPSEPDLGGTFRHSIHRGLESSG